MHRFWWGGFRKKLQDGGAPPLVPPPPPTTMGNPVSADVNVRHVFFIEFCLGFHPAWFCPLRTKGGLQHDIIYLTDEICLVWRKLFDDPLGKSATWSDYKHHKQLVFFCCLCCFPIQQWPCYNNIVTERVFNLFDDSPAECMGRRVPLLPGEHSKMYTPGTIANSQTQRVPTKIKKMVLLPIFIRILMKPRIP